MSITDELRKYVDGREGMGVSPLMRRTFTAIADRIDAEHEEAIASVMNDALYHANDKDMADLGWVRLPKDADDEYIHIGDVMEWPDGFDEPFEVVGIGAGTLYYMYDDSCEWTQASTKRHHKQLTVEDILTEFARECLTYATCVDDHEVTDAIELYAPKLRLRGDAE